MLQKKNDGTTVDVKTDNTVVESVAVAAVLSSSSVSTHATTPSSTVSKKYSLSTPTTPLPSSTTAMESLREDLESTTATTPSSTNDNDNSHSKEEETKQTDIIPSYTTPLKTANSLKSINEEEEEDDDELLNSIPERSTMTSYEN
eukprot:8707625-Ditylum_brightwellii.AAC.1